MSSVYIAEPATNGKVVLETTNGDIDIELWPKQAPLACRNFIQLSMEGYYDDTIFHRIIPGFMIQGGDRTGSGEGGESIYGGPFKDEVHSRLRFSHRGVVAMANSGPDDNMSQFFMTLGACDWLEKKHTIFGKVTGDTIFNVVQMGELDADANDRPFHPPKLLRVQILSNPFDDLIPRADVPWKKVTDNEVKDDKLKKKPKRNVKVLSFQEDDIAAESVPKKAKHSLAAHDLLNDPRLSSVAAVEDPFSKQKSRKAVTDAVAAAVRKSQDPGQYEDTVPEGAMTSEMWADRMRQQMINKKAAMAAKRESKKKEKEKEVDGDVGKRIFNRKGKIGKLTLKEVSLDEIEAKEKEKEEEVVSVQRSGGAKHLGFGGTDLAAEAAAKNIGDNLAPLEQRRMILRQRKQRRHDEKSNLKKLELFKKSLEDAQNTDWKSHSLQFDPEIEAADPTKRTEKPEDYVVYDPLNPDGALLPPKKKRYDDRSRRDHRDSHRSRDRRDRR